MQFLLFKSVFHSIRYACDVTDHVCTGLTSSPRVPRLHFLLRRRRHQSRSNDSGLRGEPWFYLLFCRERFSSGRMHVWCSCWRYPLVFQFDPFCIFFLISTKFSVTDIMDCIAPHVLYIKTGEGGAFWHFFIGGGDGKGGFMHLFQRFCK